MLRLSCELSDFLSDFNQFWTFTKIFIKVPNIKFQENPPNWIPADNVNGRTDIRP